MATCTSWLFDKLAATSYEEMFSQLLALDARLQQQVKDEINWARKVLKKQSRITWYLRWYRLMVAEDLAAHVQESSAQAVEGQQPDQKDSIKSLANRFKLELANKSGSTVAPMYGDTTRGATRSWGDLKQKLEHFFGLPDAAIEAYDPGWQSPGNVIPHLYDLEREFQARTKSQLVPKSEDKVFLQFPDGWAWWFLPRASCSEEAKAMGHCGNSPASGREDIAILSLREPKRHGDHERWEPHCTFILHKLGDEEGCLGEMKGKNNDKPVARYHKYIIALLKDTRIKGVDGGGYLPENNFSPKDLTEEQREEIEEANPGVLLSLKQYHRRNGMDDVCAARVAARLGIPNDTTYDGFVIKRWASQDEFLEECGSSEAKQLNAYLSNGSLGFLVDTMLEKVTDKSEAHELAFLQGIQYRLALEQGPGIVEEIDCVADADGFLSVLSRVKLPHDSELREDLEQAFNAGLQAERQTSAYSGEEMTIQSLLHDAIDSCSERSWRIEYDLDVCQTIPQEEALEAAIAGDSIDTSDPYIDPNFKFSVPAAKAALQQVFGPDAPKLEALQEQQGATAVQSEREQKGQGRLFNRPETDEDAELEGIKVSHWLFRPISR